MDMPDVEGFFLLPDAQLLLLGLELLVDLGNDSLAPLISCVLGLCVGHDLEEICRRTCLLELYLHGLPHSLLGYIWIDQDVLDCSLRRGYG